MAISWDKVFKAVDTPKKSIDWDEVDKAIREIYTVDQTGVTIDYRPIKQRSEYNPPWFVGDGEIEVTGETLAETMAKFLKLSGEAQA